MKIGELAAQSGASVETLRFYEAKGLLPHPRRSPSGYRLYSPHDLERVNFVLRARRMGFSLADVGELLSIHVDKSASTCGEVKSLAEAKLLEIDEKIAELGRVRLALTRVTQSCEGGDVPADHCTILQALEAEAPA